MPTGLNPKDYEKTGEWRTPGPGEYFLFSETEVVQADLRTGVLPFPPWSNYPIMRPAARPSSEGGGA